MRFRGRIIFLMIKLKLLRKKPLLTFILVVLSTTILLAVFLGTYSFFEDRRPQIPQEEREYSIDDSYLIRRYSFFLSQTSLTGPNDRNNLAEIFGLDQLDIDKLIKIPNCSPFMHDILLSKEKCHITGDDMSKVVQIMNFNKDLQNKGEFFFVEKIFDCASLEPLFYGDLQGRRLNFLLKLFKQILSQDLSGINTYSAKLVEDNLDVLEKADFAFTYGATNPLIKWSKEILFSLDGNHEDFKIFLDILVRKRASSPEEMRVIKRLLIDKIMRIEFKLDTIDLGEGRGKPADEAVLSKLSLFKVPTLETLQKNFVILTPDKEIIENFGIKINQLEAQMGRVSFLEIVSTGGLDFKQTILQEINGRFDELYKFDTLLEEYFDQILHNGILSGLDSDTIERWRFFKYEYNLHKVKKAFISLNPRGNDSPILNFLARYDGFRKKNIYDLAFFDSMLYFSSEECKSLKFSGCESFFDDLLAIHKIYPFSPIYYAHLRLHLKSLLSEISPSLFYLSRKQDIVHFLNPWATNSLSKAQAVLKTKISESVDEETKQKLMEDFNKAEKLYNLLCKEDFIIVFNQLYRNKETTILDYLSQCLNIPDLNFLIFDVNSIITPSMFANIYLALLGDNFDSLFPDELYLIYSRDGIGTSLINAVNPKIIDEIKKFVAKNPEYKSLRIISNLITAKEILHPQHYYFVDKLNDLRKPENEISIKFLLGEDTNISKSKLAEELSKEFKESKGFNVSNSKDYFVFRFIPLLEVDKRLAQSVYLALHNPKVDGNCNSSFCL